jgi:hypothetical protein
MDCVDVDEEEEAIEEDERDGEEDLISPLLDFDVTR